jgi:hypothetical protein
MGMLLGVPAGAGSSLGALVRVFAHALAPRALLLFAALPYVGFALIPLAELWAVVASVLAVEAAWPASRGAAIVIGAAATLARFLVMLLLGAVLAARL